MKIKRLYIRNIASIEKADIDFENGLNDGITGDPASIFLISGDTGSGKSVILDAIALALYKKTPRTDGVENVKNNSFENNYGEIVKVNSIEQYTRLGISSKDDCYCEVVFDGNDGLEYSAKLKLGFTKNNTYCNPSWTVKVGNGDYENVLANTGEPILSAIGLSFEQFSRMSMLAQGQFASFLTGNKKERESILEQLTNTEVFTKYGEAISSLFSEANRKKENAETELNSHIKHVLPQEDVERLVQEKKDLNIEKSKVEEKIDKGTQFLKQVEIIETANKELEKISAEKKRLEEIQNGDDYLQKKHLVEEWDKTNDERQALANKLEAEEKKQGAENNLLKGKSIFDTLSSDLLFRTKDIECQKGNVKALNQWIEARKENDALFANVSTVCEQLKQYYGYCKDLDRKRNELNAEESQTEQLKKTYVEKDECANVANENLKNKQAEIDNLTKTRKELNPQEINDNINNLSQQKEELSSLRVIVEDIDKKEKDLDQLKETIRNEESKLTVLEEILKQKKAEYDEAFKKDENAKNLLSTMQLSIEDTLKELRKKMHEEHTETCPLCGQHIDRLHIDDDFAKMLSPLQEAQRKTNKMFEMAKSNKESAQTNYDTVNGAIATHKTTLESDSKKLDAEKKRIHSTAAQFGLDNSKEILPQIETSFQNIEESLEKLKQKQSEVEDLQTQIDNLLKEKQKLEDAKRDADSDFLKSKQAVEDNAANLKRLNDEVKDIRDNKLQPLHTALSSQLNQAYPTWKETDIREEFHKYADEYNHQKECHRKASEKLNKDLEDQEKITRIQSEITTVNVEWQPSSTPAQYSCSDILDEWNRLFKGVSILNDKITDCNSRIDEATNVLSPYYSSSNTTEKDLKALINNRQSIDKARDYVTATDNDLKTCESEILKENEKIKDSKEALKQISTFQPSDGFAGDDIPNKDSLKKEIAALNEKKEDILKGIQDKDTQLNANDQDIDRVQNAKKEFEKAQNNFEKWNKINKVFGGTRFRTLVQTYILRPLLNNANIYLTKITDRYTLTCSEENEQLSIFVHDKYNKNQVRSVTVLSGGERFMISLALSLALSSLNRPDLNTNILFIDEGFGTLDETTLNSVMSTLEKLQEIAGQTNRRVGIISHREELAERIPVKINVRKKGEGHSIVNITHE